MRSTIDNSQKRREFVWPRVVRSSTDKRTERWSDYRDRSQLPFSLHIGHYWTQRSRPVRAAVHWRIVDSRQLFGNCCSLFSSVQHCSPWSILRFSRHHGHWHRRIIVRCRSSRAIIRLFPPSWLLRRVAVWSSRSVYMKVDPLSVWRTQMDRFVCGILRQVVSFWIKSDMLCYHHRTSSSIMFGVRWWSMSIDVFSGVLMDKSNSTRRIQHRRMSFVIIMISAASHIWFERHQHWFSVQHAVDISSHLNIPMVRSEKSMPNDYINGRSVCVRSTSIHRWFSREAMITRSKWPMLWPVFVSIPYRNIHHLSIVSHLIP